VNGKPDTTHRSSVAVNVNDLPLHFGKAARGVSSWRSRHQPTTFDGLLDEVSIWQRPLSQREISLFRWRHFHGHEDGLVGYWDMDEGSGRTVHDRGQYSLHGTFASGSEPSWLVSAAKPLNDVSNLEQ